MSDYKVSFFDGSIGNAKVSSVIDIAEFFNHIKYEKYKKLSDTISSIEDKKARQKRKNEILPYVTISGVFSHRSQAGLESHSGLIAIDIDGIEDIESAKTVIKSDPYSFAVFKSVSGNGLCVVVRVSRSMENHKDHFRWLEKYYYDEYGFTIDTSCKDVSRARYVSCDPDIYINPKSKIAGKKKLSTRKPKQINWIATDTQMDRIVSEITSNRISICNTYDEYLLVALSIADGYGENGRNWFHAIASQSEKYEYNQADKKFDNAIKTKRGEVKIGTFFYMAKQAGINLRTQEEETLFALAKAAKSGKSNVDGAVTTAASMGLDASAAKDIAEKVFSRDDLNLNDQDISIIEEIMAFISINTDLKRNTITGSIENEGEPLTDTYYKSIYLKTKMALSDKPSKSDVYDIIESDFVKDYDPVKQWLRDYDHLPPNPGIIDEFLSCIPYEEPRASSLVRSWMLGLPAMHSREVCRLALCLCGGQNNGKTEWYRRLLPDSLKPYYAESNLLKDEAQIMATNLIVMDDELSGQSKREEDKFKELTSKESFTVRLPYGRCVIKMPRLALLCGTANDTQIVSDPTGNTRKLPVEFNKEYNFEKYNSIDKNHLWIEVFRAYYGGETWKLSKEQSELLDELSGTHSVADYEGELIDAYMRRPDGISSGSFMSSTEIKVYLERCSGQRIASMRKLGLALKKKFKQEMQRVDGTVKRGYRCVTVENHYETPEFQTLRRESGF